MVQLEEVEDAELDAPQPTPFDEDDDADFTDTDSSLSDDEKTAYNPSLDESISDRIFALRDMVSPSTRRRISSTISTLTDYTKGGLLWGGKAVWVMSASALMVGVPWMLSYAEETQIQEMERENRMREGTGEVLAPGASVQGASQGRAAL